MVVVSLEHSDQVDGYSTFRTDLPTCGQNLIQVKSMSDSLLARWISLWITLWIMGRSRSGIAEMLPPIMAG